MTAQRVYLDERPELHRRNRPGLNHLVLALRTASARSSATASS